MTARKLHVATVGEALGVLRAPNIGSLSHTTSLDLGTGGAEANFAIGLARLGVRSTWLGRLGNDGLGRRIARELRAEGVEAMPIFDDVAPTGLLLKETPRPGHTMVSYYRGESAGRQLTVEDVARLDLSGVDLLHVTGITLSLSATAALAVESLVERAAAQNVPISFDINHRSKLWSAEQAAPKYRWIADRASFIFGGQDELAILTGEQFGSPEELGRAVSDNHHAETIVKLGEKGAGAWSDDTWHLRDAVKVEVVDTVGAGDAFAAGYIVERLGGASIDSALALATRTGAAACAHPGDWEGAPYLHDLRNDTDLDVVDR